MLLDAFLGMAEMTRAKFGILNGGVFFFLCEKEYSLERVGAGPTFLSIYLWGDELFLVTVIREFFSPPIEIGRVIGYLYSLKSFAI